MTWLPFPIITVLAIHSRLFKGKRVRVMAINAKGEVLLVRGLISRHTWELPGGAVKKGEELMAAAARELLEETGIMPLVSLKNKGEVKLDGYSAVIFKVELNDAAPRRRTLEIRDIQWFPLSNLPEVGSDARKLILEIGSSR